MLLRLSERKRMYLSLPELLMFLKRVLRLFEHVPYDQASERLFKFKIRKHFALVWIGIKPIIIAISIDFPFATFCRCLATDRVRSRVVDIWSVLNYEKIIKRRGFENRSQPNSSTYYIHTRSTVHASTTGICHPYVVRVLPYYYYYYKASSSTIGGIKSDFLT